MVPVLPVAEPELLEPELLVPELLVPEPELLEPALLVPELLVPEPAPVLVSPALESPLLLSPALESPLLLSPALLSPAEVEPVVLPSVLEPADVPVFVVPSVAELGDLLSLDASVAVLAKRVAQFRADAGYAVPLAMFGAPIKPDYWRTAEELGFGQLGLRLPSLGTDESLRLLDEFAAQVARYRSAP